MCTLKYHSPVSRNSSGFQEAYKYNLDIDMQILEIQYKKAVAPRRCRQIFWKMLILAWCPNDSLPISNLQKAFTDTLSLALDCPILCVPPKTFVSFWLVFSYFPSIGLYPQVFLFACLLNTHILPICLA